MTSVNTSNGGGTQSPQAYMSQHKEIPQLLEYLYHELLVEQPENVIQFLRDRVTKNRPARIIISGPPGAGKGTQCQLLSEALQLTHLSTGALLREEIRKGTDMGREAKEFVDRGALVPDQLMLQLVLQRLNTESANNTGWILDGFPRTRPQALALQVHGVFPDLVVLLDIRKEEALRRFSVRRMDPETEKVYILESDSSQSSLLPMPSNEIVQSRLIQRTDETPEIISFRYDTYRRNERDLVACYSSVIQRVDGARISQDIHREVLDLVKILLHSE